MRIHFDGKGNALAPTLLSDIADRLEALNTPHEDIFEARVTLLGILQEPYQTARLELLLVGRTLYATQQGATPHDAVNAALRDIAHQLQAFRILRPEKRETRLRPKRAVSPPARGPEARHKIVFFPAT